MKAKFLLLFIGGLIPSIASWSQSPADAKHTNIPGTKVSLIVPEEYDIATSFTGLERGDDVAIQVYDLAGGNYFTNAASFSKEKFETAGATVYSYEETKVNNFLAKFIHMQGDAMLESFGLVFGDSTFSVMIMALFPSDDEKTKEQIKATILSAVYEKDKVVDPFENVFFSIDDANTDLKFAKSAANLFVYTLNGDDKDSYQNEPFMIVLPLPADESMTPKDLCLQMILGLESKGLTGVKITDSSDDKVNDYPAYRLQAQGKMDGDESVIFIQTVIAGSKAVIMQGISRKQFQEAIEDFEALSSTIKIK